MKTIDAKTLKEMFISGANNLYNHYPEVDQLNVFPVPDGDTGMNMNLTATSGSKEIQNREFDNVYDVAKSFSRGLLMGARGNSGVITSQIFRGFADGLSDCKKIDVPKLIEAWSSATKVAYKAVMKPVEGTILTVVREASTALEEQGKRFATIEDAMDFFLEQARISLDHTPELLPVLKQVGVVDSGGAGLVRIFEGMVSAIEGKVISRNADVSAAPEKPAESLYAGAKLTEDEEGYGYCTQFILRLGSAEDGKKPFVEKNFIKFLAGHGKSLVTVRDDDIVKVHVHALAPGNMLNYAQQFGEFVTIVIENMSEEHKNIQHGDIATDMNANLARGKQEAILKPEPEKKEENPDGKIEKSFGLVAVSSGTGLDEMFREIGVDVIVSGGQTMNPSTEDFVNAINKCHASTVFILPNNSNIVMAASQACEVLAESGIDARVIPSKTIPQGIASAMQFNPELDADSVYRDMKAALKTVRSGSVTYAIKDTEISGVEIKKGYYMAMKDKNIVSCVKNKNAALIDLVDSLVRSDSAILTVIVGDDVTPEQEKSAEEALNDRFGEDIEIDIRRGDQPVYSFLVGVE
ncbi:MAG: DAK2 domain-containing protein [Bacilli bacterium]|nr:DAK2 domain-containing protein [Bacilli bacterium]